MLDAKLNVVPEMQTSMSLALIFKSSMFTGLRNVLNLQKRMRTIKLFKKPKINMKPRKTATTVCPVLERPILCSSVDMLRLNVKFALILDITISEITLKGLISRSTTC